MLQFRIKHWMLNYDASDLNSYRDVAGSKRCLIYLSNMLHALYCDLAFFISRINLSGHLFLGRWNLEYRLIVVVIGIDKILHTHRRIILWTINWSWYIHRDPLLIDIMTQWCFIPDRKSVV